MYLFDFDCCVEVSKRMLSIWIAISAEIVRNSTPSQVEIWPISPWFKSNTFEIMAHYCTKFSTVFKTIKLSLNAYVFSLLYGFKSIIGEGTFWKQTVSIALQPLFFIASALAQLLLTIFITINILRKNSFLLHSSGRKERDSFKLIITTKVSNKQNSSGEQRSRRRKRSDINVNQYQTSFTSSTSEYSFVFNTHQSATETATDRESDSVALEVIDRKSFK